MCDYPDPDEEYELLYADELELLRENEESPDANIVRKKSLPAKRSLDFSSPAGEVTNSVDKNNINCSQESAGPLQPLEDVLTPVVTNKRTVDDLFGDIGDIDFDAVQLPSKRQKTDEEIDLELIERIIANRKLRQTVAEPSGQRTIDSSTHFNPKENLSLNIPRWPFLPLTNSEGDRIYVRLESQDAYDKSLDVSLDKFSFQDSFASTWAEARKILEEKQQQLIAEESGSQPLPDVDSGLASDKLWVDKYKPHSYLDLLSEEPVNRALLHWLHLWDKVVFKKEVKTKEPQQRNSFSKRAGQFQLTDKWRGKREAEPELDADGRPHHRVALLCGPPGVGKTTLAHLLAGLAGYRPVELNASDERSTDAFRTALQSATLMKSVLDAEKRPNCLILDEIDGAPLPTVELLVKWCTASTPEAGKRGKTQPLRRPVIAICNDLYAPSLRPLRPVSLVVSVGGVSSARLSARLCRVSLAEGVSAPPHVLSALAARAQGDVRAAIHVLSFITARLRARARAQLKMEDVQNAAIGTKDCTKSLMQALQAIFTINDEDPNAVLKTVQASGEHERLAEGIFENYLSARVDARLVIACETLSWLRLHDALHSWTARTQNYSLYGMLPLCLASCHRLLASRGTQRLKYPTHAQEMYRRRAELDSIVYAVWRGCGPAVAGAGRTALLLDVLPLLPYLLAPALRSANVQLCSENERKTLRVCASAMCDYGLQYVQQRTPEGLYAFVLEPDINKVAFIGSEERARPPPAVRQAIAQEQQLEIIRRNEEMAGRVTAKSQNKDTDRSNPKTDKSSISKDTSVSKEVTHIPNHLQRLKPKDVQKNTPQVHKDFFGRIVPLSQVQRTDATPDVISSSGVYYQYREGFNNAVRRNVRMRDML